MDILVDTRILISYCLTEHHPEHLRIIHSSSAHLVMESMHGVMAEVDLLIYVLEKEVEDFQR